MVLLTLSYKFVFESFLSFCRTCWGANSSKGEGMKVDRIFKRSEKFATHAPHLDGLYYKRFLDKVISISIKHPLSRLFNKSKSNRIDGYSHIMTENRATLKICFAIWHTIFEWQEWHKRLTCLCLSLFHSFRTLIILLQITFMKSFWSIFPI